MSNTLQRLLLFFVGVPLFLASIFFLPYYHHAVLAALVLVLSGGSALELEKLFRKAGVKTSRGAFLLLGVTVPLLFFASTFFDSAFLFIFIAASLVVLLILWGRYAFAGKERLGEALGGAAALSLAFLYPGLLAGCIILVVSGQNLAKEAILGFAIVVLGNDSMAWLVGMTLGRKRNIVAVSPNKSIAGFVGGMLGSVVGALSMQLVFPEAYQVSRWAILALGLVMGAAVITGDLFESALKRSTGTKDSGSGVPGRGGFLDSFDSLLFSAPVFLAATLLLGLFK